MSAADRIEAVASELDADSFGPRPRRIPLHWAVNLRAIAAELRGAPALTEAERAFFEAAAAYCETQVDFPGEYLFGAMLDAYRAYRAYRALRTERTPS